MDRVFSFLLWPKREGFVGYSGFEIKGDRELEVRTATYGPGIDQSQHAKPVSHIIKDHIPVECAEQAFMLG